MLLKTWIQILVFTKLLLNMANCKVTFNDEHNAVILLISLTNVYIEVKTTIIYGRDEINMDMVVKAFRSR